MIHLNYRYRNKNNKDDLVRISSIEYIGGLKYVIFNRFGRDTTCQLPIEMFEKNFERVDSGNE
jgi:hypothetical protein